MMQDWFKEAKLGIFIHWGAYAVGKRGGESWPLIRGGQVSFNDYFEEMKKFTADKYDPNDWAELIQKSGAKYAVLTTKHHDGIALWPTKENAPSIPNELGTPDLVEKYLTAIRKKGIKTGLYFSHTDWSHEGHLSVLAGKSKEEIAKLKSKPYPFREEWNKDHNERDLTKDPQAISNWEDFLAFEQAQIKEILTNYGEIDLIWFDVMMSRPGFFYPTKQIRDLIHSISERTIINSRLGEYGDYETPEQFIPVHPPKGPWEFCVTTNNTWSYTGKEEQYKSVFEIIMMFCECLGMGGNMLLNIGPDEHGIIPAHQRTILEELGEWIERNEEAVYQTDRGLPHGYAYHFSSMNKTKEVIYLYVGHDSKEATPIKGIRNEIKNISVLGSGTKCGHKRIGGAPWMNVPGTLWIDVPQKARDKQVTVLKIELVGALDLYGGEGVEITVN